MNPPNTLTHTAAAHTPKISVFIITLNEAEHLGRAIDSVWWFADEVIVVDSGSTDDTVAIAEAAGAQVYYRAWSGYGAQKKYALSLCKHSWCINLDGDERIPERLAKQILDVIRDDSADVIRLHFNNVFMGQPMSAHSHKIHSTRVFKKRCVSFDEHKIVHEGVSYTGRLAKLYEPVLHYGYESVELRMHKQNRYSSLAATQKHRRAQSPSRLKLWTIFPLMFLKAYVVRRYFMDGTRGLIHAFIEASYAFLKEAKLYEHHYRETQRQRQLQKNNSAKLDA